MLCPGDGSDPVQFIDNRDLAEWCVRLCENQTSGTFNAVGPSRVLTMKELIDACLLASTATGGKNAEPVWVPAPFLDEHQVSIGGDLPIWVPGTGADSGFHKRSHARAVAAGLTYRPEVDTCTATLEWWPKELARRERVTKDMIEEAKKAGKPEPKMPDPRALRAGMSREREREILKAWHDRKG
jgi:2'-hydroxyisoflavone reductase